MKHEFISYMRWYAQQFFHSSQHLMEQNEPFVFQYSDGTLFTFKYEPLVSNQLQHFSNRLFVYSSDTLRSDGEMKSRRFYCIVPSSDEENRYHSFDIITEGSSGKVNLFTVNTDDFYWFLHTKVNANLLSVHGETRKQISEAFKQAVLSLPAYRLLHLTGLLS